MKKPEKYCTHCGERVNSNTIALKEKLFCCEGYKTVFEILNNNNLSTYYTNNTGFSPKKNKKYAFLSEQSIQEKLIDFKDENVTIIHLNIPKIHCSSCIWLLEHLYKIEEGIQSTRVNFSTKKLRIVYDHSKINLEQVVKLLARIGYEPRISMIDIEKSSTKKDLTLSYKIGIAGFCFGNVMLLSFPGYFQMDRFIFKDFHSFFGYLNFAFAIPSLFYSGFLYLESAWKGLRTKYINIDVPIALGMIVLFARSTFEVFSGFGEGYFDSLTGLVFFLLIGKYFQNLTYKSLSFERDYRSYFPLSAIRIKDKKEENISLNEIQNDDIILIRNQEIIPANSILIKGKATIDNSFVTGESKAINKKIGDTIYAGGRQIGEAITLKVIKTVSQSYLTQLWNHKTFSKKTSSIKSITDKISKNFTIAILSIATISAIYWWFEKPELAINVFTAVLIIACPCAIALSAPFSLGNTLRIFGRQKLYLKNTEVIEQMAEIDHIVFDKTGTITKTNSEAVEFIGDELSFEEKKAIFALVRNSYHPLSKAIYKTFSTCEGSEISNYKEISGKGIEGKILGNHFLLGSKSFLGVEDKHKEEQTQVWLKINQKIRGHFVFKNNYRPGLSTLIRQLKDYHLSLLSGDNSGESTTLSKWFNQESLYFNKSPKDKLNFIDTYQKENHHTIMMIGDGLNDAGALKQANIGIAVSEDVTHFSPACDGILEAGQLNKLPHFIQLAKQSLIIIRISFFISLLYNVTGLFFAVQGLLSPLIAAIIMPLSSISVIIFVSLSTNFLARKKFK